MNRDGKATISDIKKHIRACKRRGTRYNWLGFVENRDLTPEVEALFTLYNPTGAPAYNWVSGNARLHELEAAQ